MRRESSIPDSERAAFFQRVGEKRSIVINPYKSGVRARQRGGNRSSRRMRMKEEEREGGGREEEEGGSSIDSRTLIRGGESVSARMNFISPGGG